MTEQPAHNAIEIEGARARNLKNVSVTIPLNRWTAVVGMSGSGKSSLVFETIHAESQRRFFETLPHGIRVWLEQWERPDADRISHLPASLAIGRNQQPQTGITRISQTSGLEEELIRIMIAQGELVCPACQLGVRSSSVEQVLQAVEKLPAGVRYQIGFPVVLREQAGSPISPQQIAAEKAFWEQTGYSRFLAVQADPALQHVFQGERFVVVVDRLQSGQADLSRIRESIEQALTAGLGHCLVLVDHTDLPGFDRADWLLACQDESGRPFHGLAFSHGRECPACLTSVPELQPELFWGGRTHGNCGQCSGEGIIRLKDAQEICPECSGTGLGVIALHARLANETGTRLTFAELLQQRIETLPSTLESVLADRSPHDSAFRNLLKTVDQLVDLGLGPLRLNRLTRTLSRGEFQKVSLISACRQQFVNTLILLEEICNGLHPEDRAKVSGWIRNLVSTGNTVITVEHHADVIAAADHVIELGPEAGVSGGEVVYTGSPEKYLQKLPSFEEAPERRIAQAGESLEIRDVHLNSLQGVSVRFPLNRFIVVSGVCSSGKTSLICQALSLAVNNRLADRNSVAPSAVKDPFQTVAQVGAIEGGDVIDECLVMTASNWTGSSRSTPATYLKVFDEIRKLFAESVDAQKAGFKPSHFSFNSSSGGRCQRCRGVVKSKWICSSWPTCV
ncbi:MAG: hypothetical protein KDA78_02230 [Planctomycetaceae bacterium]|nr:hypothetical protein [Planctomycetaceae bacterium]